MMVFWGYSDAEEMMLRRYLDHGAFDPLVAHVRRWNWEVDSTTNPDGSPQLTLVWIGLDGDDIVAGHLPENRKVKNIRRDPRVAISLQANTKSAMGLTEYAVLYGEAHIEEGGAPELLQRLVEVYIELPHAHIEIEEIFGFGVRCIMRWRYDWVDVAGKKGHVRGVDIFQVKNGSICEKLSYVKG